MIPMTAATDEELDQFEQALKRMLLENLGQEEYNRREQAVRELMPLLDVKYENELKRALELMKLLQDQGLASQPDTPRKQGYLFLQSSNDPSTWKKLYFTLRRGFLDYRYTRKEDPEGYHPNRRPRKGVIALKFATLRLRPVQRDQAPPQGSSHLLLSSHPLSLSPPSQPASICVCKRACVRHVVCILISV
jgi:hypothetical protein